MVSERKKNLYPRYELIDEYRRVSENKLFHMVSLSKILELLDSGNDIVEDIRNQEEKNISDIFHSLSDDDFMFLENLSKKKIIKKYLPISKEEEYKYNSLTNQNIFTKQDDFTFILTEEGLELLKAIKL